jgi:predicted dehydrogenase
MTMKPIKFLVAGAGHLGRFHAQKIIANPKSELVGIYDSVPVRAEALAAEVGSTALASMDACSADAAIIATTTSSHANYRGRKSQWAYTRSGTHGTL